MNYYKEINHYYKLSWEHSEILKFFKERQIDRFLDVACGSGIFIDAAVKNGHCGWGTETNAKTLASNDSKRLKIFEPSSEHLPDSYDAVCMFQFLEHVENPLEFLRDFFSKVDTKYIIIAVPGYESISGRSTNPALWPPHHRTLWTEKALTQLGVKLGWSLCELRSDNQGNWPSFNSTCSFESTLENSNFPLRGFRHRPKKLIYHLAKFLKINWAINAHTLLAIYQKIDSK